MSSAVITVQDLRKSYRYASRRGGLLGAIGGAFSPDYKLIDAVDGISFEIAAGERVALTISSSDLSNSRSSALVSPPISTPPCLRACPNPGDRH